jgi:hypothetical protein
MYAIFVLDLKILKWDTVEKPAANMPATAEAYGNVLPGGVE